MECCIEDKLCIERAERWLWHTLCCCTEPALRGRQQMQGEKGLPREIQEHGLSFQIACLALQGKLRIGLAEQTVLVALAHAVLLHGEAGAEKKAADPGLANRLEEASQAVKQAYSQCPSYDDLISVLLEHGLTVTTQCFGKHNNNNNERCAKRDRG